MADNIAKSDTGLNFKTSTDTGLYYTNTNTEDNQTVYYFRGDNVNNYVQMTVDVKQPKNTCTYNGQPVININHYDMEVDEQWGTPTGNLIGTKELTEEECTVTSMRRIRNYG